MHPSTLLRRVLAQIAPCIVALVAGLTPGCDNVACVFGPGNCSGGVGGGLGELPASVPEDGEWIESADPRVSNFFPSSSAAADTRAPIVIVFSESMTPANLGGDSPSSLASAFELRTVTGGIIPVQVGVLVGDGRVLVLLPALPFQPDTQHDLVLRDTARLADRTGQALVRPANDLVGSFTTAASASTAPRVLATWPLDGGTGQSATSEIVVVFDREMNPATVDGASFDVTVAGVPPAFDPSPLPLAIGGVVPETRVFLWRSVDGSGVPVPLGEDVEVEVTLSDGGNEIEDEAGEALATTTFAFETAPFSAPLSAAITSDPDDAIGIDQISGPATLAVEATLSGAQSGDLLVVTMFGLAPGVPIDPPLIALRREVAITAPFDAFTMTAGEIDLLLGTDPVRGRFADGAVVMAFQLRRGSILSPVRLLDVDAAAAGIQSPLLDTVPPTLLGLGTSGNVATSFRSDLRDVVLVGRASEPLSRASVDTALGDNSLVPGEPAPVVGSDASGLFVAAPVRLGVLAPADLPLDYDLAIYDRARNSATVRSDRLDPTDGFRQLGASGPGNSLPGGLVAVEVFDATTLAPIVGANIHVVENLSGTVIAVVGGFSVTDVAGFALVAAATGGETILTVEKAGYDLFTFDGVPTDRLGVPLAPTVLAAASAGGTLAPIDPDLSSDLNLPLNTRSIADSRRPEIGGTLSPVNVCTTVPPLACPFGPYSIRPRRIGAQTAVTVEATTVSQYSALTFLKTAELVLPRPPAEPGSSATSVIPIQTLLGDPTLDPEERPIEVAAQLLSTAAWPSLPSDPAPAVSVEATSPGIPGTVTIGRGVAFDDLQPADTWLVRAAYPGSADGIQDVTSDELGRLVTEGTIDSDLFLRVDVVDAAGNRGGARPRLSLATGALDLPAAAILPANPATPNAGGMSFDLTFPDVLPDALSAPGDGLYRIVLTDSAGRGWTLYRPDPPDALGPNVVFHVPDLLGSFPLASGPLDCQVSVWSWGGLDLARFLWTDLEREHDLFAHSAPASFTPP